jgi:Domain of unknown function (DUF4440)
MIATKIITACLLFCTIALAQQTRNKDEEAVWQQEQAYWQFLHNDQKAAYLALWDERFIGWPRFAPNPEGKDTIASDFFAPVADYKLEPLSVREYGKNIVITFYRASVTRNGTTRTSRLSHTWMSSKSGWHIIGGMSADDATSPR